jgi:hypothetical protein
MPGGAGPHDRGGGGVTSPGRSRPSYPVPGGVTRQTNRPMHPGIGGRLSGAGQQSTTGGIPGHLRPRLTITGPFAAPLMAAATLASLRVIKKGL